MTTSVNVSLYDERIEANRSQVGSYHHDLTTAGMKTMQRFVSDETMKEVMSDEERLEVLAMVAQLTGVPLSKAIESTGSNIDTMHHFFQKTSVDGPFKNIEVDEHHNLNIGVYTGE